MNDFNIESPPLVKNGNLLSAYFTNQLSSLVNNVGGVVYGANVPRWTYGAATSINNDENIYVLSHKYNILKLYFVFGNTDMQIKVWLSKSDFGVGTLVHSQSYTGDGPATVTLDLSTNPNGFSVATNEIYFIKVEFSKKGVTSDMGYIDHIYETQTGAMVKPTLDNITSATVLNETYLNSLVNAARTLKSYVRPQALPFVGIASTASASRNATFLRWKVKHLSRYLHISFKSATDGGGADGVILYLNNVRVKGWDNNGSNYTEIFDMQALPNSIAEPTFGAEYELKLELSISSGQFRLYYIWELPYL